MASEFDLTNALESYHAQSEAVNQIWGFYGLMVVGVVTISWTASPTIGTETKVILSVIFGLLALGNLVVVCRSQSRSNAMLNAIKNHILHHPQVVSEDLKPGIEALDSSPGCLVGIAQWISPPSSSFVT